MIVLSVKSASLIVGYVTIPRPLQYSFTLLRTRYNVLDDYKFVIAINAPLFPVTQFYAHSALNTSRVSCALSTINASLIAFNLDKRLTGKDAVGSFERKFIIL